jgi:hypothetical protein
MDGTDVRTRVSISTHQDINENRRGIVKVPQVQGFCITEGKASSNRQWKGMKTRKRNARKRLPSLTLCYDENKSGHFFSHETLNGQHQVGPSH